ncbi:hypothetical protein Taro_032726, partial [Colocasia esculenta]|nr:hypothetical protein [Colocasia esculenta]
MLDDRELCAAEIYILLNCAELECYVKQFDSEIIQRNLHLSDYEAEKEQEKSLALWLRKHTPEEVNAKFFQEDLVDDVELTTHIGVDEFEEPICLSKGNEVEEVDPHEIKGSSGRRTNIDVGQVSGEDSDEEEEYTSDECEDDDKDGAELDISFWSFCASSSSISLEAVYASSSYGRRTECVCTSSFFGRRIYGAR